MVGRPISLAVLLGLCALLPVCYVQADDLSDELTKHVAELSKRVEAERGKGSALKSKNVKDKVAEIQSQVVVPRDKNVTIPILSHQRDDRGVAFPDPKEVLFKPVPTSTPRPADSERKALVIPTPRPYKRYPLKCERNQTTSVSRGISGDSNHVVYDVLYLPEDLLPSDPTEVFGAQTTVRTYGPNSGEGVHVRMEVDEVPCLPYRTRITETTEYIDLGRNALKNYDKKQSDEGEFHPWIAQKLFGATQ